MVLDGFAFDLPRSLMRSTSNACRTNPKTHKPRIPMKNPGLSCIGSLHFGAYPLVAGAGFEPATFGL